MGFEACRVASGEMLKRADFAQGVAVNVALKTSPEIQPREKDDAAGTNCQSPAYEHPFPLLRRWPEIYLLGKDGHITVAALNCTSISSIGGAPRCRTLFRNSSAHDLA